jgi:hypothetical protein
MSRPRVLTVEVANRLAELLTSDVTHTIESVAAELGIRSSTVRDCMHRYETDKCTTDVDVEVGEILARAKAEHVRQIRAQGFADAAQGNRAGTSWAQWQCEVQAPNEHKRATAVELSGPDGGPMHVLQGYEKKSTADLKAEYEALVRENMGEHE